MWGKVCILTITSYTQWAKSSKKVVQFREAALLSFDVMVPLKTCTYISIYSILKYFFALLIIPFLAHYVLLYIYGSKQFPKEILA